MYTQHIIQFKKLSRIIKSMPHFHCGVFLKVFSGCTKRMKISHKRLNADRRTTRTEDKILVVEIKKGWKEGTKVTFPKEGDETPTNIPADVVFVVKDKPHPLFRRDGSDIVYPAKVSLREVRQNDLNFN